MIYFKLIPLANKNKDVRVDQSKCESHQVPGRHTHKVQSQTVTMTTHPPEPLTPNAHFKNRSSSAGTDWYTFYSDPPLLPKLLK